ncbi:HutD family protein, partial [Clostridium sp. UBA5119]|uniref:HutD family protein n=1 Tax=Clostridium sp. UBA5119 TaxID=1946366 RepID=UPI003216F983
MGFKTEIITKDKIKTSSWSGGTTNEIYIYPKDSNYMELNFKWRISSATVELEHSTFTNVPKIYRYITTLEGSMDLCHNKGPLIHLEPFEVHGFSGDVNTESFGTVRDFNLMIGPGCYGVMDALTLTE